MYPSQFYMGVIHMYPSQFYMGGHMYASGFAFFLHPPVVQFPETQNELPPGISLFCWRSCSQIVFFPSKILFKLSIVIFQISYQLVCQCLKIVKRIACLIDTLSL